MRPLPFVACAGLLALTLSVVACGGGSDVPSDEPAAAEPAASEAPSAEPAAAPETPADMEGETESEAEAESGDDEPEGEAAAEGEEAEAEPARPRFIAPIRGPAEVGYLRPTTRRVSGEVVTTFRLKNLSSAPIAGFKLDEFWWDADGNALPGDSQRLREPFMPGEEVTIELRVPANPAMDRNNYQFSHANGEVRTTRMPEF